MASCVFSCILPEQVAVGQTNPFGVIHQFWDAFSLAFHNDGPEIVDVAITKRMAVDIKGQHAVASRHFGEGQLFLNIA